MAENKYTKGDLSTMQAWPLARKIQVTQTRLLEWKAKFSGQIYISFSGGKDSTVLADLAARVYAANPNEKDPLTLAFVNTGLEYPEIQKFVPSFADWLRTTYKIPVKLETLYPEMTFPEVLSKYGYPVIGKEVAKTVHYAKRGGKWAVYRLKGLENHGKPSQFNERFKRYAHMIDAPFELSSYCCDVMKKRPAHKYATKTGRKAVLGTMAEESALRQSAWLLYGCNAFEANTPKSAPLSFWTNQDILQYLKMTGIPFAPVYGEIIAADPQTNLFEDRPQKLITTKCEQTGCMYCMFGIMRDKEPNRFQRMKQTHPKQYAYCIGGGHFENGLLKPDKTGLGLGVILDYIGKPY